jgi:hypothetical protein
MFTSIFVNWKLQTALIEDLLATLKRLKQQDKSLKLLKMIL